MAALPELFAEPLDAPAASGRALHADTLLPGEGRGEGGEAPFAAYEIPDAAIRVRLPDLKQQTDYTCGAAALEAVCRLYGVGGPDEKWFARKLGTTYKDGTSPRRLAALAAKLGLAAREQHPMSDEDLKGWLDRGVPVLCAVQAWGDPSRYGSGESGHYVVAIGYDGAHVYFEDPSLARTRGYMDWQQFDARWHDIAADGTRYLRWGLALGGPRETARAVLSAGTTFPDGSIPGAASFGLLGRLAEAAVARRAEFILSGSVGEAIKGAAESVADSHVGRAVGAADKALGKLGGREDCEWVTIHGAKGTARICIGADGQIEKGPAGLVGKPHGVLGHQATHAAHEKARARKEEEEKKEATAANKVRDGADKLDDLYGLISDLGPGAIAALATKTIGERVGVARDAARDLRDKLVERYGEGGATAIVIAGIASVKALDLVVPGAGTLMGFVPGSHLVAALPVAAAVETAKCVGDSFCKAAREAGTIMSALAAMVGGGPPAKKQLSGQEKAAQRKKQARKEKQKEKRQARMSADAGEGEGKGGLSPERVEELGKKFMQALTRRIVRDLMAHVDALKKAGEAIKAAGSGKGKKGGEKGGEKGGKDKG